MATCGLNRDQAIALAVTRSADKCVAKVDGKECGCEFKDHGIHYFLLFVCKFNCRVPDSLFVELDFPCIIPFHF